MGSSRDVGHSYDTVVLVHVVMCDCRPLHSCKVGRDIACIEGSRVFKAPVWHEFFFNRLKWSVMLEVHSWELGGDGGLWYVVLLNKIPRGVINFLVPFKQYSAAVRELQLVGLRPFPSVTFYLSDDGVQHWVTCQLAALDLFSGG